LFAIIAKNVFLDIVDNCVDVWLGW